MRRKNYRRYWDLSLTETGREKHLVRLDCALNLRFMLWSELPPVVRQRLAVMWRNGDTPATDRALASLERDNKPKVKTLWTE